MKNIFKLKHKIAASAVGLFLLSSCEITNLDINTDPNNPTSAQLALLLPTIENDAVDIFEGVNQTAHGFAGQMTASDDFDLNNNSFNGTWNSYYQGPGKDLDEFIKAATKAGNVPQYLGVSQVLKAYFTSMMVDMFGDIPYSEAFSGNAETSNINPKFDDQKAIYDDCIKLCTEAVTNLGKAQAVSISGDLFYAGNTSRWIKLANTLKLRLLVQTRKAKSNASEIAALVTANNLINVPADDFVFQYNTLSVPDGRHPWFQQAYTGADNNFTYISHQLMVEMLDNDDPRWPFYFKRQQKSILNQADPTDRGTTPCTSITGCKYGYIVLNNSLIKQLYTDKGKTPTQADLDFLAGIFGRDRGDNSGVPLDQAYRTAPGTYPAAGAYDVAAPSGTANTASRYKGNGIFPIITTWMTKFYQIEAILSGNLTGDAKGLLEKAIREQMAKVQSIGLAADANAVAMPAAKIDAYVKAVLARYDAASSNEAKLNVVLKQAWFANWGNGFESWNAMRRTGYPSDLQRPIALRRDFAKRLPYPAQELSLNKNAPKDAPAFDVVKLFWDTVGLSYK